MLCAVLLLSVGCRLRADVEVTVEPDASGTLTVTLDPDAELRRRLAEEGLDLPTLVSGAVVADDAWDVRTVGEGVAISVGFADPEELARRSRELAEGLEAAELAPLRPITVDVTGRELALTTAAALVPRPAVSELGYTPEEATSALADAVDYRVTVAVPGDVVRTSPGGDVEGRTVTWTVPAGERVPIELTARRPLLTPARIAIFVAGLAVVVVAVAAVRARLRRD